MKRILVANRGEPVIRAVKTLRRMEIATAVVYAPEDAGADWLAEVDYAYPLAERSVMQGKSAYLDGAQIVEIARAQQCDAVWPAWGFLAEHVEFAEAVIAAGITWIGPPPAAMHKLGSKEASGNLARAAGVPTVPEVVIDPKQEAGGRIHEKKDRASGFVLPASCVSHIGYPLLLKPALGGGGQGQAVVRDAGELAEAWQAVCRINEAQFRGGPILVQRYLERARHIEVQVLADLHGTVVVFHERECSIQRRNQKIIEESPSPALGEGEREALLGHARTLAVAAGYASAGTIEFLFADGRFYFLEMNTRLQVEHPITEETTRWVDDDYQPHSGVEGGTHQALPASSEKGNRECDVFPGVHRTSFATSHGGATRAHAITTDGRWRRIDFVEEMVRIAQGERLRFRQETVRRIGHAIEARIYAEDPARDFLPSPGVITSIRFPAGDRFRIETAVRGPGAVVDPRYDPMLAKLIVWGEHRAQACDQLRLGLERTTIGGIATNIGFLHRVAESHAFRSGDYSTKFVAEHPALLAPATDHGGIVLAVAAVALYVRDRHVALQRLVSGEVTNVAAVLGAVPPNGGRYTCSLGGRVAALEVFEWAPDRFVIRSAGSAVGFTCVRATPDEMILLLPGGRTCAAGLAWHEGNLAVTLDAMTHHVQWSAAGQARRVDPHAAPGGGRLVRIAVEPGMAVRAGDLLYITEAMKMEARICARFDGTVAAVAGVAGDVVAAGDIVVTLAPTADEVAAEPTHAIWTAEDLRWPADTAPSVAWFRGDDGQGRDAKDPTLDGLELLQRYFQGYDIPADVAAAAANALDREMQSGAVSPSFVADTFAAACEGYRALDALFSEDHAHAAIYFIEHVGQRERRLPKATEDLLATAMRAAGLADLKDSALLRRGLLRALQAVRYHRAPHAEMLLSCFERFAKQRGFASPALAAALEAFIAAGLATKRPDWKPRWSAALRDYDWALYYLIEHPPVAAEYWDLYEQCLADPLAGLPARDLAEMRRAASEARDAPVPWVKSIREPPPCTSEASTWLPRWFQGYTLHALPVSPVARACGVTMLAAVRAGEVRLIAVACVPKPAAASLGGITALLPAVERTAIEAYWSLRAYEALGLQGGTNHVFLFLPPELAARWDPEPSASEGISPTRIRRIAGRVMGFARNLRIGGTEVVLTINRKRQLVQVWHARDVGVVSRPPMPLVERMSERDVVGEKAADLRQQRLGKLLNRDRARLLFDDGTYEELFFPEADDPASEVIGLNVYRGVIDGHDSLVYAGDFRQRGGALGEREGKKLAATVVLAYALQLPLIGIHDGAGANIKGSVASLGWAGAYFGAIAATGGFSSPEKFHAWLARHHARAYFEKVLRHFGAMFDVRGSALEPRTLDLAPRTGFLPLIHLHLHLGAAVGMLVYGPSVSSAAMMVDHPEVYRLLTGAATVERVTGEKGTNYQLGGAEVHRRLSGEIDVVYPSEEAAIQGARALLALVQSRAAIPARAVVTRREGLPQPEIPVSGGVIVGREAIEANVDAGRFLETRDRLEQAGGLLTGYAQLGGQPVVLAVTATDYGMHHGRAFKKMQLAAAAAQDFGPPLIIVVGASWDRLSPVVRTEAIYQQHEMRRAIRAARVPKIGIALGPRSLERSIHEMMDLVWYVERGPESDYERQRAHILTHGVTPHLHVAMDWCADILRYLPRPWERTAMRGLAPSGVEGCASALVRKLPTEDPVEREIPDLAEIIPTNLNQPYDMREVITRVADTGSWREFAPGDGQPLHVGVATIGGGIVGIIADAPQIEGGAQTVVSISKFTRFHRFCARFGFPIVELNDSPAFRPGKEQERSGIQGEGGKSIREEVLSSIPKIAVTLRQNYGGRYIHANLVTLGPPRCGLIVAGARLGVMGADGAVGVLHAKELAAIADAAARARRKAELIAEYERTRLDPEQAIDLGYAEAIIPLAQLRRALAQTLADQ
ncbi:MAG: ATP-grasp domain-containing protein [Deltaproteobacteria bacterium]|nr:ATP-grasp domain-containing protein [Deltaproteobacteria bacterium]